MDSASDPDLEDSPFIADLQGFKAGMVPITAISKAMHDPKPDMPHTPHSAPFIRPSFSLEKTEKSDSPNKTVFLNLRTPDKANALNIPLPKDKTPKRRDRADSPSKVFLQSGSARHSSERSSPADKPESIPISRGYSPSCPSSASLPFFFLWIFLANHRTLLPPVYKTPFLSF